jgi:hypothetical protein
MRFHHEKAVHYPVERQIMRTCRDQTHDRAEQPSS